MGVPTPIGLDGGPPHTPHFGMDGGIPHPTLRCEQIDACENSTFPIPSEYKGGKKN